MNAVAGSPFASNESQSLLRLLHWALLWSPLRDDSLGTDAWQSLGLPGDYQQVAASFNRLFLIDLPVPRVSLLFNVSLQREAGACREEWMRIAEHLGMERIGPSLPPDHLALACEVLAHSLQQQEKVLCEGIMQRYLLPWLERARNECEQDELQQMLQQFGQDLEAAMGVLG